MNIDFHRPRSDRQLGFTMIELMIVVTVVAVLAAIGYPSYQEQVAKSRRADAQRALAEAEQYMRRFYGTRDTFAGVVLPSSLLTSPAPGAGPAAYNIQLIENGGVVGVVPGTPTTAATTFTLRAVRTGNMATDRCGDLQITNTGVKTLLYATGGTTLADCFKGS